MHISEPGSDIGANDLVEKQNLFLKFLKDNYVTLGECAEGAGLETQKIALWTRGKGQLTLSEKGRLLEWIIQYEKDNDTKLHDV